jgi:hypothetical protein
MPQSAARMVRGFGAVASLVCLTLLAGERIAVACSCAPVPCASAVDYDAIFEATVVAIEGPALRPDGMRSTADPVTVRLETMRALRGEPRTEVVTAASSVSCGYEFRVGRRYLIFASRRAEDGQLTVGSCGLTRPLEGQSGMVRYVESLSAPSRGGRIFGRVALPAQADYRAPFEPISGARIVLAGPQRAEAHSDGAGAFEFIDLPPGSYRVVPEMPADRPELSSDALEASLDVAHACADLLFAPRMSSLVRGTVESPDGQPLSGVFLTMRPAAGDGPNGGGWGYTTGPDGAFVFDSVAPGQYVVGVSQGTGPAPMSPFPPTVARTAQGASVVDVRRGAQITLLPMQLQRQAQTSISGRVVTVNGTPVADIPVVAAALAEDGRQIRGVPVRTGPDGGFRLPAYTGVRYRLLVGQPRAPEASLDVTASGEPITVTLPRD